MFPESSQAAREVSLQLDQGEITGIRLTGVGSRDNGPATVRSQRRRYKAISRLARVVAGEHDYVLCGSEGGEGVGEGGREGGREGGSVCV